MPGVGVFLNREALTLGRNPDSDFIALVMSEYGSGAKVSEIPKFCLNTCIA